jgi:outer membrane protein assembly factor BamE (lipoprotein component of BamABCDE complex)
MRRYLILTLIVALAGILWISGCTTAEQGALERSLYVDDHPEISELMADAIINEQVVIGMTEDQVMVAWGKPVRAESTQEEGVAERWIYGNYFVGGNITSLYFDEDGKLARYEVNNQKNLTHNGTISTGGSQAALSRSDADFMMQKGSGP